MYAYAWQNIEMAILGVGFVWLGHFIAFTFYPQIATIRSEGRSPKIFEAITLLVSYSIAFFLVTITSWLIDAFDIRSSPLQAARACALTRNSFGTGPCPAAARVVRGHSPPSTRPAGA